MFVEGILAAACICSCGTDGQIHDGVLTGFALSPVTRVAVGTWENAQHHDSAGALISYDALQLGSTQAGIFFGAHSFLTGDRERVRMLPVAGFEARAILIRPGLFVHFIGTTTAKGKPVVGFAIGYEK